MKLRHILVILREFVFAAIAYGITFLVIQMGFPWIPNELLMFCQKSDVAYVVVTSGLQILALCLFMAIDAVIHKAFYALWKQDKTPAPPRPRPLQKAPDSPQSVPAMVTGKRIKTKRYPRERHSTIRHFVGFRLGDGRELWFEVNSEEYKCLPEGAQGQLAFQGKAYRSFQKNGEGTYKSAAHIPENFQ